MDNFVAAIDETPLPKEVQEVVVAALAGVGFTAPEHLAGTAEDIVKKLFGGCWRSCKWPAEAHFQPC